MVERHGTRDVIVVLGATAIETLELITTTVTAGDPSYAGPLAGVALRLPVYHILEPELKTSIASDVYNAQLGMFELVADVEKIHHTMKQLRECKSHGDG